MKRFFVKSKKRNGESRKGYKQEEEEAVVISSSSSNNNNIEWEMRPGGMLVQKRSSTLTDCDAAGPMINIKVSHASYHHHLTVPSQSTFGNLKRVLSNETGLDAKEQRILFRGKEKEDDDHLHMAGIENMSKVVLLQDPASKENNACQTVATIKAQVNKLSQKVGELGRAVESGSKVVDKEFVILTDLLTGQLLKLDSIMIIDAPDGDGGGGAKIQRRIEVRRIQSFIDALDSLRKRNSNSDTTKWGAFDSAVNPPITKITQDWVLFDD
ncbi:BAG family molecular chaperone regulator 4-like [Impatiens glandulifera]|uniref:BAG family molecular chaperone regulator 4-like n=1 Tax=Impatiens glandulifera TaxID=253017 RepID=UPI001FB15802|nr:BAG family molecular chaperone regulator 4-like [Impatiens glandulifera]